MINSYWMGVCTQAGIMLIAVLGVSILIGFTGQFSFGHAGFMAIGGYVSAICVKIIGMPMLFGLLIGMTSSTLIGIAIGYPSLRLRGDYFLIATLGFGEAVKLIIENLEFLGGAKGMPDVGKGVTFPVVLIIDIVIIMLLVNFLRSKHGRNCIAIREEETAARAMGIDVTKYKVTAFAISCALAGLSGALFGHYMNYLQPAMFNMTRSNELAMTVIMGGFGSLTGSIIATLILVPLPEILRFGTAQEWRMVIYGVIVVFIILFKPSGLMGYRELTFSGVNKFFRKIKKLFSGGLKNDFK